MNQKLQNILTLLEQNKNLTAEERESALKALENADKELEITAFKLERTEKVKKTTAILLEETIEELEQKRKAVEEQNRELEIEASLERVRAVAMGMNKSDDLLSICEISFKEFKKLGFDNLRNTLIHIPNDEKGFMVDYDYSDYLGGSIYNISYNSHPIVEDYLKKIKKADDAFAEVVIEGSQLESWKDFLQNNGQREDPKLDGTTSLYYYLHSIGIGDIGLSTLKPLDESQINILKRFRNVFNLAYRRYTDITNAEAQAREAQIEAALERVRSRSLAMHHTSELQDVINTLHQQFKSLEIAITGGAFIAINEENKNGINCWGAGGTADYVERVHIPFIDLPIYSGLIEYILKGPGLYTEEFSYEEKIEFFNLLFKLPPYTDAPPERKKEIMSRQGGYTRSCAVSKYTSVFIINHHGRKFLEEENNVLIRFGKVFEQSYTRFLDLQKAEAHARQAQIETALERVRSRSMAMHSSDEFVDASDVMVNQLKELGIDTLRIGIGIINKKDNSVEIWSKSEIKGKVKNTILGIVPAGTHPIFDNMVNAWKENKPFFSSERVGDEVKEYYEKLDPCLSYPKRKEFNERETMTAFFFNHGSLNVISLEPLKKEDCNIMIRFAKVFGQIYQRFLDLQKAEAQAREAQIELALERVRARTMAMQKSEELKEVIQVVYDQFVQLTIHIEHTGFILDYKARDDMHIWLADRHEIPTEVTIPFFDCAHWNSFNEAKATGKDFFANHLSFEEKNKFYQDLFEFIPGLPEDIKEYYFSRPGLAISTVLLENVGLYIENFDGIPYTEDENNTLMRFGKVFQQTYTRFLDLQKAEAQAREAQIEAALERVRSRTMGMQKSEELKDVIRLVYEQFVHLKINVDHAGFVVDYIPKGDWHFWIADKHEVPSKITHTYFDSVWANQFNRAKEEGIDLFATNLNFEEKNKFYQDLFKLIPGVPEETLEFYFNCPGLAGSTALLDNVGLYIENFSGIPYTDEENNTLMRFGKVFQQTYTRFLDLQKAEAQAREAQIEAALERVRSRSMAMHHSDELLETANVVLKQLQGLGLSSENSSFSFGIFGKETGSLEVWQTLHEAEGKPRRLMFSFTELPTLDKEFQAWKKTAPDERKNLLFVHDFSGKLLEEYVSFFESQKDFKEIVQYLRKAEAKRLVHHDVCFSHGNISFTRVDSDPLNDEELKILKRFAAAFEQTYIRFLDLQKAEAQAREAQIEATLEKVRSRSLAMHKSDELQDVVNAVFERLNDLKIDMNVASIFIFKDGSKDWEQWVASSTTNYSTYFHIPYMDLPVFRDLEEAKQKRKDFYSVSYSLEQKNEWFSYAFENTEYKQVPDDRKKYILESEFFLVSFALSKHSGIQLAKYEGKDFTQEENEILKRFARVFEQAYIRFLDLQKAEAQARESQIEAALERVRSRTMAMQKSEDLNKAASDMFKQIQVLGMQPWACGFNIFDKDEKAVTQYMSLADAGISPPFRTPLIEDPFFINIYEARQKKEKLLVMESSGESLAETYRYMFGLPGSREIFGDLENSGFEMPKFQITHCAYFSQGYLVFITYEPVPEAHDIFRRFAKVFEQTYTRFLDLQKAEAQAREAQIEAALERVRSRTMAMQQSEELAETAAEVFKQLINLGIEPNRIYIAILKDDSGIVEFWITDEDGSKVSTGFKADLNKNISFQKMYKGWKEKKKSITIDMQGEELQEYFKHLNNLNVPFKGGLSQKRRIQNIAYFSKGFIGIASHDDTKPETIQLLERFAAVFNLTYTRFNDLQQAEAQNKIIQAENARKTKELEDARHLQLSMLPKELPKIPHLDIAVHMKTATEVGGDYYDFNVDTNGTLTFVLGDATGHGMMSGMMVSIMKSFFISHKANIELKQFFENANNSIKDMHLGRLMMSFMGIQINSQKVIATNAGMPSLIYFRNKSQKAGEFVSNNLPLGAMKGTEYSLKEINYEKGDTLLLMSDGFGELKNVRDTQYGYPRIINEFKSVVQSSSNEIVEHLKTSASEWANGTEPDDDVTFVVIKFT